MESLYIVMPAYNEEANIEAVVNAWYPILKMSKLEDSRLVIADSGSEDSTHEILLNMQKTYTQLEILSDTGRQHGPKVIALYDYAIRQGADYIFQTDSDGQTDPREFQVKLINCYFKQRFKALFFSAMKICPILGKIFPLTLIYF